jgi:hypothetical protein
MYTFWFDFVNVRIKDESVPTKVVSTVFVSFTNLQMQSNKSDNATNIIIDWLGDLPSDEITTPSDTISMSPSSKGEIPVSDDSMLQLNLIMDR